MKSSLAQLVLALAVLPTLAIAGVAPSIAHADPEPEVSTPDPEATPRDRWDRVLAAEIVGGIDTPYGLVGGAIVISPIRYLALDLGGGVSRDGGRVAGGARLVLAHANAALGIRVGFAGGPLTWDSQVPGQSDVITDPSAVPLDVQHRTWDFVGFVDMSLSLEWRFDMGVYLRLLFGVEHTLSTADRCSSADGACAPGGVTPTRTYLGLALGYAFDI